MTGLVVKIIGLNIDGLDSYEVVIIYDVNGCNDCTILAENYIIPKCLGNKSLVLRISEKDERLIGLIWG